MRGAGEGGGAVLENPVVLLVWKPLRQLLTLSKARSCPTPHLTPPHLSATILPPSPISPLLSPTPIHPSLTPPLLSPTPIHPSLTPPLLSPTPIHPSLTPPLLSPTPIHPSLTPPHPHPLSCLYPCCLLRVTSALPSCRIATSPLATLVTASSPAQWPDRCPAGTVERSFGRTD